MKANKTKLYAKALAQVLEKPARHNAAASGVEDKIVKNFVKLLVGAGLERKSKEILDLAENLLLAKQGKRKITLQTARKMTAGQRKMTDSFVNKGDVVKEKINPELIAGIKIIINDSEQFDGSLQSKLRKIIA